MIENLADESCKRILPHHATASGYDKLAKTKGVSRRGAYARAMVVSCGCVSFKCFTSAGDMSGKQKMPPAHILENSVNQCRFTCCGGK